ncbi:MAG: YhbY family RNA-binding protein [Candidatus Altiarchaeota archaeon]
MKDIVMVRVGKNGVTPALIEEIISVLKKHKKIKIKMLKSSLEGADKHEQAEDIRRMCKAKRASLLGHTITLEQ